MSGEGPRVNDFVIRFANVNGTGSASANALFAKSIFRMGIPVAPKNIFPSNIQGMPTWYDVRVNEDGHLGRRAGIDIVVGVNPQSLRRDIDSVRPGGTFIYDSSKTLHAEYRREDIRFIGVPMMDLSMSRFEVAREQQLFKNIVYVGALAALLEIEVEVIHQLMAEQFAKKEKLIPANHAALKLGVDYVRDQVLPELDPPFDIRVERRDRIGDHILIGGNEATALGAIYGGATVMAWYPITPSTSVAKAFAAHCKRLRTDADSGRKRYAFVQAEDELAAVGIAVGANWNGARAFTATSGPGVSLMSEFIGLAYFAEIPLVLVNVQRGGPSTGMPTRTQQSDILACAYASHGDTRHILLFPSTPAECFEMTATAFDLADRFQTPVILMSDLDLGMNQHLSPPLAWDDARRYDLGKVLGKEDLEALEEPWGRYRDVDGDGICHRTLPGTHPTRGAFFTRGTSRDEYARYTEDGETYRQIVDRIDRKWETAKTAVPTAETFQNTDAQRDGLLFFGTTAYAALEALELLDAEGVRLDALRVRALPFGADVETFVRAHERVFVVEQNRDAQFRSLLANEFGTTPVKLIPVLNYDGLPITADTIRQQIAAHQTDAVT